MNRQHRIFIVDDERILRVTLADDLRDEGYEVYEFSKAGIALLSLRDLKPDIIISDIRMPEVDGIELLEKVKNIMPEVQVIMMTAYGKIENAVHAMKLGAADYLTKPFTNDELLIKIRQIEKYVHLKNENTELKKQLQKEFDFSKYIGSVASVKKIFDLIEIVAQTSSSVLLVGETGTGKELITNIIHFNSLRKDEPFIKVSCAILARELFESELFGHEKGAFTGAQDQKIGRFERAHCGTLYLDDIDDMPIDLQVKLLRALEEGEIERLGGSQTIKIDVRLIASTKKNLLHLVKEGKFREDLYYRLNVFPIELPALRERREDIKVLAEYFMHQFSANPDISISPEALDVLLNYPFPGNVRELRNLMERLVLLTQNETIELEHIPSELINPDLFDLCPTVGIKPLNEMLIEFELAMIRQALQKAKNNKARAADLLGIPATTLRSKIDKLNTSL